jgi:glucose/arabinose dehydrogenase
MQMRRFSLFVAASMLLVYGCFENKQQTAVAGEQPFELQRAFANIDIFQPVALLQAPGDDSNWYIVQKQGRVLRVDENQNASTYIDISDRVESGYNEAGLLGMAFHPDYQKNGLVYMSYTKEGSPLVSVISRFKGPVGNALPADSEEVLLQVEQPYSNHNGGQISFGPEGYLMIGLGDGGSGGDPKENGQDTNTLLGAMLRIDVNAGSPYGIPQSNPFAGNTLAGNKGGRAEIYAWGMRNPWRWSFDRKTGELWVADVGQNEWEEVNLVSRPGNYGWNLREGTHCYKKKGCDSPELIDPVAEYSHGPGCSVTGGYVYRGDAIEALQGVYLYGDFCSGTIWGLYPNAENETGKSGNKFSNKVLMQSKLMISSFAEDNKGELYVIHYDGEIYKIVPRPK